MTDATRQRLHRLAVAFALDRGPVVDDAIELAVDLPAFALVRHAFGFEGLQFGDFDAAFYGRLSAWDQQNPLDRTLGQLLDAWGCEPDAAKRQQLEERMRQAIRDAS